MKNTYLILAFVVLLIVLFWLHGCASVDHLADTLDKRQIQSCILFTGTYTGVGVHGLVATGGATILDCLELR